MSVALSGNDLTFPHLHDVALRGAEVQLTASAIERMNASRAVVERLVASGATAYGINTGFGKLASVRISTEQVRQLQVNLVRSHACGLGVPLSEAETRAMMLLRANALAKGFSGVRPRVVETLCQMLNAKVHPVIPSQGSVGASGDLAPLAHLAQVVIGEGHANFREETLPGGEAMKRAGITPVALEAKEGLSLLNGTQAMLAVLSLERTPFLCFECHGRNSRALHGFAAGQSFFAEVRVALTDHHLRQMRQWRKVTRCAHRTLRRNYRMHLGVQHLAKRLHHPRPHAAKALRQGVGAQQHHRTRLRFTQRHAEAAGVGTHQIHL